VDDRGRGSVINDVHKRKKKGFWSPYRRSLKSSPPVHIAKYFAFQKFTHDPDVREQRGKEGVFPTDNVGQGGGFQKITFWSDMLDG